MNKTRRHLLLGLATPALLGPPQALAQAGAAPTGAATRLRVLSASPAGGTPDLIARRYAEAMAPQWPGGIVVENRPGAGGQVAAAALRQSAPDGSTLFLAHSGVVVSNPWVYAKLAYDPAELVPVSLAAETSLGLAVGSAVPASVTSLAALFEWMRANPTAANFGSPGNGSSPHVLGALLFRRAKVEAQHVAYSAGGPGMLGDLFSGRLAVMVLAEGFLRPHAGAGRLRVLATGGRTRSPFLPNVPTFEEQGQAQLPERDWFGFFAPPRTAPEVVAMQSAAVRAAGATAAMKAALDELAVLPLISSPEAMAARITLETGQHRSVVAELGIRIE